MSKSLSVFYVTGDAEFKRRVKAEAAARGVEMSDLIRTAIDLYLASDARQNGRTSKQMIKPIRYENLRE